FFSSRRRHTRFSRDWSSDVCSSDLLEEIRSSGLEEQIAAGVVLTGGTAKMEGAVEFAEDIFQMPVRVGAPMHVTGLKEYVQDPEIGRASCRERVWESVHNVAINKHT